MKMFKTTAFLALAASVPAFAALTDIIGPNLTTQSQLDRAIGATSTIQYMKVESKKVPEITAGINTLIADLKASKTIYDPALVSKFSEHLVHVNNLFVKHNSNGAGDTIGAQPHQKPDKPSVSAGTHAS